VRFSCAASSAYALAGIAGFSVILYVCGTGENEDITNFHGLGKPISRYSNGVFVSMAGIPIFAGFFAKMVYSIKRFRLVILLWL
jgi:NADH-quinone oxidoreductase subunit N